MLKVKPHQYNSKKVLINDTLLSVMNRTEIIAFLHMRAWRVLVENGVKLKFEEEDRVFVTLNSSGSHPNRLLSNYANFANLHRMSMSNAGPVFEAAMLESSSWSGAVQANLIVTNLGVLVFERDADFQFERKQELVRVIPIVEFMTVGYVEEEKSNGKNKYKKLNKLVIKYKFDPKLMF